MPHIDLLMEKQRQRRFCISLANKQVNAFRSLIQRALAYDTADGAADEKLKARAATILARATSGKPQNEDDAHIAEALAGEFEMVALMLQPLEARRNVVELDMKKIVRKLPVAAWQKEVKGLGELGLAAIKNAVAPMRANVAARRAIEIFMNFPFPTS